MRLTMTHFKMKNAKSNIDLKSVKLFTEQQLK